MFRTPTGEDKENGFRKHYSPNSPIVFNPKPKRTAVFRLNGFVTSFSSPTKSGKRSYHPTAPQPFDQEPVVRAANPHTRDELFIQTDESLSSVDKLQEFESRSKVILNSFKEIDSVVS
eukprot:TRINITY_DN1779_c0_g1_i1.p1 TRINITY_DN1779_c0_g1~~TRINITY_DN1779_c0_g1_i1.p1  ORF type:complete len:118 (-),score=13.89 TRINITY_DN1779_c0_g1_i1:168-521(-)